MQSSLRMFGTKVALRVFGSFVAASLVPLAISAMIVYTRVSSTLHSQAQAVLEASSRTIGQQLLERLLIIDDSLSQFSADSPTVSVIGVNAAQIVTQNSHHSAFGNAFTPPRARDVDPDRSTLVVETASANPDIFLSRPVGSDKIIARVDPAFLWNVESMVPADARTCIVHTKSQISLFCSAPLQEPTQARMISSRWELFLPSRFEADPWSIVVSEPESVALAPLSSFKQALPLVVAASVIVTLLLSSIQLRRILQPLRTLVAGTRRIAQRNFSARVKLAKDDEFAELARAINDMSERLGNQFDTMTALAEIDRHILSSQSIDEVLDRVLERVVALNPNWGASILLIDKDQQERGRLHSRMPEQNAETALTRITLDRKALAWLSTVAAGSAPDPEWVRLNVLELPVVANAKLAAVIPVFRADSLRGALIVQSAAAFRAGGEDYEALVELTDRLAVALAAAEHESELFRRAHFDSLTGLPNRQLCLDRLYQAIAQARREEHKLALLFIDLDRFKNINDTLGHVPGDEILKEISLRLKRSVRETDTVARLGGDEYVVILPHISGVLEVETIVEKIFTLLKSPFNFNGREIIVTASVGVTIFPDDATDAESLLQKADTAMYAAKDTGRARIEFFEEEMDRSLKERLQMQEDLNEALKRSEFEVAYQAQLNLETGRLICMEALLRWRHPRHGPVPPTVFVPVLEGMGKIGEVGRWVIETALREYSSWLAKGLELPRISVNVSSRQLLEGDLESLITRELRRNGLSGHNLELELTESTLVEDFDRANEALAGLTAHGIRVAIDDFGAGYASFGYLHGIQFDALKIDRAFVQGLPGEKSIAIIDAILAVARALGKEVVAEGVQTEPQRAKLVELGCTVGQGYLLSVPITGDEVLEWSRRLDVTSVIEKLVAQNG